MILTTEGLGHPQFGVTSKDSNQREVHMQTNAHMRKHLWAQRHHIDRLAQAIGRVSDYQTLAES